ncbi:MAG: DNA mismatch repair endonuclease MutL [Candidatus Manganitrophaceae bacterium]|nr:MAG: DNA mismatch repair endonuclease MutL [Candidatus Manganitrophaceae bacterium]
MPKINILPENLANKIAAGEVVERPASVIKELVENAIDAGSRRIFVSLLEGGVRRITVQDDGEGMTREDALLAFQRHATSKVRKEADLSVLTTLGFRGEALPSIASIAKVRLVTQSASDAEGTEILLEGGAVESVKGVGAPQGSLFEVSDLFYNTPARRKFLKSGQTELSHASDVIFHLALSHPMIHFRLTHGKKVLLECPAVSDLKDRILQLFGEEVMGRLMEAHGEGHLPTGKWPEPIDERRLYVDTYFSRPPLRGNHRKDQYLFVNQRPVRSPLLSHAIYDAYGSYLMKGEHPFYILFLSIDPAAVDVNVHPMKKEVRFQHADPVHEAVRRVVRTTLSFAGMDELPVAVPLDRLAPIQADPAQRATLPQSRWVGWPDGLENRSAAGQAAEKGAAYGAERLRNADFGLRSKGSEFFQSEIRIPQSEIPLIRPLGQIYGTFLLAEIEGEFTLIDQHTAHERILYERFLERWRALQQTTEGKGDAGPFGAVQPLLVPQQIDLPLSKAGLLRDHLRDLSFFGWGIEHFGETTFLVREVPALISQINLEAFLLDLTDDLAQTEVSSKAEQPILNVIASMACHGAVRANQPLTFPEIEALLKDYFESKTPPTCPHGRPILLKYPLIELEKLFRRR